MQRRTLQRGHTPSPSGAPSNLEGEFLVVLWKVFNKRLINPLCGFWLLRFGKVCKHTLLSP